MARDAAALFADRGHAPDHDIVDVFYVKIVAVAQRVQGLGHQLLGVGAGQGPGFAFAAPAGGARRVDDPSFASCH